MRLTNLIAATAALSLIASPVVAASSNPAAKLSLVGTAGAASSSAQTPAYDDGRWQPNLLLIGSIVIVAVLIAVLVLHDDDDDDDDTPASA